MQWLGRDNTKVFHIEKDGESFEGTTDQICKKLYMSRGAFDNNYFMGKVQDYTVWYLGRIQNLYALYKNDERLCIGSVEELAKSIGRSNAFFYRLLRDNSTSKEGYRCEWVSYRFVDKG